MTEAGPLPVKRGGLRDRWLAFRNRTVKQIRRTYYAVEPAGGGYQFSVFRQIRFQ